MSITQLPARPTSPRPTLEQIPQSLQELERWLTWRFERHRGRWTKVPDRSVVAGKLLSATTALHLLEHDKGQDGIGIVLGDGLAGIDLDKCFDPIFEEITAGLARDLHTELNELTYVERSPSGTGFHALFFESTDQQWRGTNDRNAGVELYNWGRFFTFTGQSNGKDVADCSPTFDRLRIQFALERHVQTEHDAWTPDVEGLLSVGDLTDRERELHALLRLDDEPRWEVDNWPGNSERDLAFALSALRQLPDATNEEVDHVRRASIVYERSANQAKSERADYLARTYARARAELAPPGEFEVEEVADTARVKRRHLEFQSIGESLATLGPIDWLVDDYIERQGIGMLWGDSSAYKSFLAVDLGLSIATGTQWHGHPVQPGAVLYVAGEGVRGIARRAAAWGIQNDLDLAGAPFHVSRGAGNVRDPQFCTAVVDYVAETLAEPLRLVIVDTLHRNFGGGNENESQDISMLFDVLERGLARRLDCVVMLVHHSRKDGDEFRGSSSLHNGLDWEFQMQREGDASRLIAQKMKDAEEPREIVFKPKKILISMEHDIDSLVLQPMSSDELKELRVEKVVAGRRPGLDAQIREVIAELLEHPIPPIKSTPPDSDVEMPYVSLREFNQQLTRHRAEQEQEPVSAQNLRRALAGFAELGEVVRNKGDARGQGGGFWVCI